MTVTRKLSLADVWLSLNWPMPLQLSVTCIFLQAFNSLGEAAYDAAPVPDDEEEPQTYALSQWFSEIVEKLLAVTDRYGHWQICSGHRACSEIQIDSYYLIRLNLEIQLTIKISEKMEWRFSVIFALLLLLLSCGKQMSTISTRRNFSSRRGMWISIYPVAHFLCRGK